MTVESVAEEVVTRGTGGKGRAPLGAWEGEGCEPG